MHRLIPKLELSEIIEAAKLFKSESTQVLHVFATSKKCATSKEKTYKCGLADCFVTMEDEVMAAAEFFGELALSAYRLPQLCL